ncbi:MAG: LamG domain-containing protein, partial [Gemmatimonadaceae bacterium]|nr:LamG domain-containing protein [Gemmatimonadaceae bacterium]
MNNYNITNTSALIDYSKSAKSLSSVNFNSAGYFVTSTSLFNNITSYSISLWFYMNALGTYILTSKQHDGNNTYCVISIGCYSNTGGIFASGTAGKLYYHGKNNVTEAVSTSTLLINRWYFFTIVASNTKCQIYINGLLDSSTNGDYSLPNATAVTNSHIGYWFAGGARQGSFINGNMDDFRFYETELTINQIQELYKGRLEIITPINNDSQFIENLTGSNLVLGKKGVGANYYNYFSNLTPSYGSGGHGAGYFGGSGLVIIKIPNYTWSNVNFNWKQIKNINTASPLIADKTNLINLNYNSNIF